jgi:hypothetical protein
MNRKRIHTSISLLCLLFLFAGLSFSEEKGQSKQLGLLEDIVLSRAQNILEVKILAIPFTSHRLHELSNPNRIIIDLFDIGGIKANRHLDVNDFGIKTIRAGMFKSDVSRIVFDLEDQIPLYEIERISGGLKVKIWKEEELKERIGEEKIQEIQEEELKKEEVEEKKEEEETQQSSTAKAKKTGDLVGIVYRKDGITPVRGAIVQVRDIQDDIVYKSGKSDIRGVFRIEGIEVGLYQAGIIAPDGKFLSASLVGIKDGETTKVYFSLIPPQETALPYVSEDFPPKNEIRFGRVYKYDPDTKRALIFIEEGELHVGDNIRIKGLKTDFYQKVERMFIDSESVKKVIPGQTFIIEAKKPVEVGDFVYLVLKKKAFLAFLTEPCGLALIVVATTAVIYVTKELPEEPEVSPFKNKKK